MSARASWFRCDPSRLLGALAGMEPDSGYLYTIILMRIYEVGGPISDDEGVLARRTGYTVKRVTSALSWLVDHGKVDRLEDGSLDSETTHEELAFREKSVIDAQNAGKSSAKRRQTFGHGKPKQKQQNAPTPVEPPLPSESTPAQRPSTDREVREELSSDSSKRVAAPKKSDEVRNALLAGLTPEIADAMIDHRKKIRAPLTPFAAKHLLSALAETGDADKWATTMIANGWRGFKPEYWQARAGPNGSPPAMKTNPRLRAIEESQADANRGFTVTIPGI